MLNLPLGHKLSRHLTIISASVLVVLLIAWIRTDPTQNLQTDWTAFDNAGDRLLAGETVYRPFSFESEPLPYLYPPFALWLALPLTLFGFWGSFITSALMALAPNIAGLRLFSRSEGIQRDRSTGIIVAVASGATISSTLIGQYSGFYVLAFGAAVLAYRRERHLLSGVALALLWLKPNIAIAVPVVLLWSRSWRSLTGFGLGTAGMALLSLPFGIGQWGGFISNIRNIADLQEQGLVPVDKMITVLSTFQNLFGLESSTAVSAAIWLPIALVLGIAILTLWTPARLAESPVRAFGALALFVVAANPRMYFYDGTLVALGLFGLWLHFQANGDDRSKRIVSMLGLVAWFGLWGNISAPLNVIVGPTIAMALIVAAIESRRAAVAENVVSADFVPSELEITGDLAA